MDQRILKHAEVLVKYSLDLKENESLLIMTEIPSLPLARACYLEAIKVGAHPRIHITDNTFSEIMLKNANETQLKKIIEYDRVRMQSFDAYLTLWGTDNTRSMANVSAERMKISAQGRKEITSMFYERLAREETRWCGTLHPCQADAQEGNMSLQDFEDFVYEACKLNESDPVTYWMNIKQQQDKICTYLNQKSKIRIISEDTDLSLTVSGRKWINCSGNVNFPDGEVFTGPVEDSVEGYIRFSFPAIYQNKEIEDVRLWFEKGKVVKATASKNEDFLNQVLDTDQGARYVGEIAVGTNYGITRLIKNMLFDEKIGGTVHLAVGRSIPESLGKNESVVHWDMLCNMKNGGKIFADDELIYENGNFIIEFTSRP
ncbi:MAG: aminopeptidase [Candidatus Cloacimonetes bacterium]|nr:aminopeptidase [Candidatus Cloacimonadota bacterium]